MFRKIFKSLLLIVLFFSVLEICARLDDWIKWGASPLNNYSRDSLSIVDQYGFRNRPNAHFEKWKINQHGFRGPEFDIEKPKNVTRIMILGASETFGLYENENMEYPAQLQSILNQNRPGEYQVINAAVPGISPPRLINLYKKWLYKFKPDIVYYYPSPSIYLLQKPPGPVLPGYTTTVMDEPFQLRIQGKFRIVAKEFIPNYIQTALKQYIISESIASIPEALIFRNPPPDRLDLFKSQLRALVETIAADGSDVVLITHANRISNPISDEERQVLIGWRKLYPHVDENCFLSMEEEGNKIIKEVANQTGADVVDADAQIPKGEKYFADHIHFSNEGASQMADLLKEHVLLHLN